jgi:Asp-tRNA(Asn)/Glu-tRNA(Gln) amidotransferase A subunit family amidase
MLAKLSEAANTVMCYEGARFHQQRYEEHGSRLAHLADVVREGLAISAAKYEDATRFIGESRLKFRELFKKTPVILVPAAVGPAPVGLTSTGDPRMNAPWTALGVPAISIPMPIREGLPLGLQLTADRGEDARVIRAAMWMQRVFATS